MKAFICVTGKHGDNWIRVDQIVAIGDEGEHREIAVKDGRYVWTTDEIKDIMERLRTAMSTRD